MWVGWRRDIDGRGDKEGAGNSCGNINRRDGCTVFCGCGGGRGIGVKEMSGTG